MSRLTNLMHLAAATAVIGCLSSSIAAADPLSLLEPERSQASIFDRFIGREAPVREATEDTSEIAELPAPLRRHVVDYSSREAPGTIIVDTANTYLYFVLGSGKTVRYGVGVGRDGFTWSGVETIVRKAEWPDWYPPAEMLQRQPYLPRVMAGGPGNPLGARALYLGGTAYRIHGTNQPASIGHHVSSGCIRMTNDDVMDLYGRVSVGTKVIVLSNASQPATSSIRPARTAAAVPTSATHAPIN